MDLATVTPSFVIFGAPNDCSITTLRPFGPSVVWTASASRLTPSSISARASLPKRTSFALTYFHAPLETCTCIQCGKYYLQD